MEAGQEYSISGRRRFEDPLPNVPSSTVDAPYATGTAFGAYNRDPQTVIHHGPPMSRRDRLEVLGQEIARLEAAVGACTNIYPVGLGPGSDGLWGSSELGRELDLLGVGAFATSDFGVEADAFEPREHAYAGKKGDRTLPGRGKVKLRQKKYLKDPEENESPPIPGTDLSDKAARDSRLRRSSTSDLEAGHFYTEFRLGGESEIVNKTENQDEGGERRRRDDSHVKPAAAQIMQDSEMSRVSRSIGAGSQTRHNHNHASAPVDGFPSDEFEMRSMSTAFPDFPISQTWIQPIPASLTIPMEQSESMQVSLSATTLPPPSSSYSQQSNPSHRGFQESPVLKVRVCVVINLAMALTIFTSLVLGLVWSIVKDDVQGGFTMAAYLVGSASLVAYTVNKAHKKNCRCYPPRRMSLHGVR